jgi:hypothetical protein
MVMLAYAENHKDRFPTDFPLATFVDALEDAYSAFLEDLEDDRVQVCLEHPIARLFMDAKKHGVIEHSSSD